ncbi:hypothetical protein OJAV_G00034060 [Oryzias javanicus]|uniref:ATP synthase mitochondrial F1 complex assembly factor 1 n=1 Tax=Oryzias javanicus TaxID=123683 RepID=A0A3S2N528_ORYJA|nr:hypothetical protein OJAV_G00034060 [Oryzias javanicus]
MGPPQEIHTNEAPPSSSNKKEDGKTKQVPSPRSSRLDWRKGRRRRKKCWATLSRRSLCGSWSRRRKKKGRPPAAMEYRQVLPKQGEFSLLSRWWLSLFVLRNKPGFLQTLASILNLEMIEDKTGDEVAELWMQYYSTKDTISAAIPSNIYDLMFSRSKSCPMFLYALPRKEGYEFFVAQWSGHELHFTSLINVQTLGENAPSQLILYHYPELKETKRVVLMTAEMDPKFVTVQEAQCLASQVQLFYGTQRQETYRLVETFNHHPADFKHMSVIAELEQSGIGSAASPQLS